MFKDGKAQRNAHGNITKAASFQSRDTPSARIEPNRKWFTNTRVISQDALAAFRGAVAETKNDPYSYLLKQNKLPMSLIRDNENTKNGVKQHAAKIAVQTAPFSDTFGPKAQRKRPKLAVGSLEDLVGESDKMFDTYYDRLEQARLASGTAADPDADPDADRVDDGQLTAAREAIFSKGQSKRIWNELYKVIDSSDVIIHVLDARDPLGTRCRSVEKYIKEEAPHKHLLFVLNKCDLIPTSVAVSRLPFFLAPRLRLRLCSFFFTPFFSLQLLFHVYLRVAIVKSRPFPAFFCLVHCLPLSMGSICYNFGRSKSAPPLSARYGLAVELLAVLACSHQGVERVSLELSTFSARKSGFVEHLLVVIHTFNSFSTLYSDCIAARLAPGFTCSLLLHTNDSAQQANWVRLLSKEYPTLAFHASITHSFGKGSLISLLRQFSSLHASRKQISVGFIGYPNTGKSSIINTLRKKKVCTVAPIPGETKIWQYITLMKRIYLIDCPGVVPPNMGDSEEDILLRGVVRIENVENPEQYVAAALKKCKKHHVEKTYDVHGWNNHYEFLEMIARKGGRLLKGGEADMDGVAKMVLNDFLRGKLPWFTPPPTTEDKTGIEGRDGKLGEMTKKRKRTTDEEPDVETDGGVKLSAGEDFEGFSDEESDDDDEADDDEAEEDDDKTEEDDDKTEEPAEEG